MLEARIVSSNGSLYFSGKSTAHDLESLRAHVRDFAVGPSAVRLDVNVTDEDWAALHTSGWLDHLARAGAFVRRCPPQSAESPAARPASA